MICSRCNIPIPHGAIACPVCNAPAPPSAKRAYGLYIVGALLCGSYAVVLFLALTPPYDAPSGPVGEGLTFWSAAFAYYCAKKLGGRLGRSAIAGACVGMLVFMAAAFISGWRSAA